MNLVQRYCYCPILTETGTTTGDHGFTQKEQGSLSRVNDIHPAISVAGTGRILGRAGAEIEVGNIVCGIGLRISLGELLFELREQHLILLVENLCFLPQPFILLHYVTVLQVQLGVQPFHCYATTFRNRLECPENQKNKTIRRVSPDNIILYWYIILYHT